MHSSTFIHTATLLALGAARERIDMRQALRALSGTHAPRLAHLGIGFDLRLPEHPLDVHAVPDDLPRLFAHIADVAAGVLRPDSTLHVLARAEGQHAVINWRDAGEAPPLLSRAFEATGPAARPRVLQCRAIAERHGARIYTAPSPLGGDCLTLRFPLHGGRDMHMAATRP
jgi:hypothetical protein